MTEEERKQRRNASSAKWRKTHVKEAKARRAARHLANPEKSRLARSKWYKAHSDAAKAATAKWRTTHVEETRTKRRAKYKACPDIDKAATNQWRQENAAAIKAKQAALLAADPLYYVKRDRARKEKKAGRPKPEVCEECGRAGVICYDHCHKTKKFRGWLCRKCNLVLGLVDDNPETLSKLIKFLKRHSK